MSCSAPVRPRRSGCPAFDSQLRGRLPVVGADQRLRLLGPLEGELGLGQPGGGGGLLEEVAVHPAEGGAHPQVQVGVGELAVEELQRRHRLVVLQRGDGLFLGGDGHLVGGGYHLGGGDQGLLLGGRLLQPPLRPALFDAGLQLVGLHLRLEVILRELEPALDLRAGHVPAEGPPSSQR